MDEPVLKNLWDADVPASDPRFALAHKKGSPYAKGPFRLLSYLISFLGLGIGLAIRYTIFKEWK